VGRFRIGSNFIELSSSVPAADGTFHLSNHCKDMKSTSHNARRGMMTFVATIFSIACIIAVMYFVFFHPGTPALPG
jgi:hypothetical protein